MSLPSAGKGLFQGVLWGLRLRSFPQRESRRNKPQESIKHSQIGVRCCCCGIPGGANSDLFLILLSKPKACSLIHACLDVGKQTPKTGQITNSYPWGEKEGRNTLQIFVKLLNMVLQDPETYVVLEEIWSTYIWSSVSFEMQSMPKMWNNRKLG